VVSLTAILLITGCLEKTSDEVQAIDPRFVTLPENTSSAGSLGVQTSLLDTMEGPRLEWILNFRGEEGLPIDVDIRSEQGKNLGKWMLAGPGESTQTIPAELGPIQIQAFQDLTADGPTDDDPFGWLDVEVGTTAPENTVVILSRGGKLKHAQTMGHVGTGFEVKGKSVQVTLQVESGFENAIDVDFRSSEGLVYKAMLSGPGEHSISVPANLGTVQLQAFQDLAGDGPSDDDPFGWVEADIAEADLEPMKLSLAAGAKLKLASRMGHGAVDQGGQLQPFSDFQGQWTLIRGRIQSSAAGPLQVDFRVPDLDAPGGNRFLGRSLLPQTGVYQLQVPRDFGVLILEVFQDLAADGPTDDDPYALVQLSVGDAEALARDIDLVAGARAQPGNSVASDPNIETLPQQKLFSDLGSDSIRVSGTLSLAKGVGAVAFIDLDLFAPDTSAPGGRRYLGKLKFKSGPFSFQVPRGFGLLELEAFGDLGSDGPTPGDPFGRYSGPALNIQKAPYVGVDIVLNPT
jgi:hypothetical protein